METPARTPALSVSSRSGRKMPLAEGMRAAFLERLEAAQSQTPSPRFPTVSGRARLPLRDLVDSDGEEDSHVSGAQMKPPSKSDDRHSPLASSPSQRMLVLRLEAPSKSAAGSPSKLAAEAEAAELQRRGKAEDGRLWDTDVLLSEGHQALPHSSGLTAKAMEPLQLKPTLEHRDLSAPARRVLERTRVELMNRLSQEQFRPPTRLVRRAGGEDGATSAPGVVPVGGSTSSSSSSSRPSPMRDLATGAENGQKVQHSPSELSTAPTAEEVVTESRPQGPAVAPHRVTSPAGSSGLTTSDASPGHLHGVGARHTLVEDLQDRLQALSQLATATSGGNFIEEPKDVSLEEKLVLATRRARHLWGAVESAESLVKELQTRMDSPSSSALEEEAVAASQAQLQAAEEREKQLKKKLETLQREVKPVPSEEYEQSKKKATRLSARLERLQQEHRGLEHEVGNERQRALELQNEVERLEAESRAAEEEQQQNLKAIRKLQDRLYGLAVKDTEADEVPLATLVGLICQDWCEAMKIGRERVSELNDIKERNRSLAAQTASAQAELDRATQKLAAAEEELARRSQEQKHGLRVSKEELAVARAEHAVLSQARASWQVMRPQLLSLVEDLRGSSRQGDQLQHNFSEQLSELRHAIEGRQGQGSTGSREAHQNMPSLALGSHHEGVGGEEDSTALRKALDDGEGLRAKIQALERDKAHLIQEQEETIRQVRARVAPLQQRASTVQVPTR